jgi:ABC-2 type transport system ATP-binding protein
MEEIETICQRVAIIDHGRILKEGTLEELVDTSHADLHVHVAAPASDLKLRLKGLAEVVQSNGDESQAIIRRERKAERGAVTGKLAKTLEILAAARIEVLSVETREHNLERLFLELTGRTLRD